MSLEPVIFFVHAGKIPRYLRHNLENVRTFNPQARIILIADQAPNLSRLGIECLPLKANACPLLQNFRQHYVHLSTVELEYERFCFERWFYLNAALKNEQIGRAIYLDSDCLLFTNAAALFDAVQPQGVAVSWGGSPHCAFIQGRLDDFLKFMLAKFCDSAFLEQTRGKFLHAAQAGAMQNFTDMTLFELYIQETSHAACYPHTLPSGILDHNIHLVDDFVASWRFRKGKRLIKKVFWEIHEQKLQPYFQIASTGQRLPALTIHFQSGAKRLIHRFNRYPAYGMLALKWRKFYFNHILFPTYDRRRNGG